MMLRGDPFQRLTICGVFQRSIEVLKADPVTFLSIGGIGAVPGFLMNWFFLAKFKYIMDSLKDMSDPEEINKKIMEALSGMIGPLILGWIIVVLLSIILKVATIRSTVQIYVSQKPAVTKELKHGARFLPRIFCLSLAFGCGMMVTAFVVGLCIGIISAIFTALIGKSAVIITILLQLCFQVAVFYVTYSLIFWDIAVVVEDLPEFRPFFRSFDLVRGQWCFVFCAIFLETFAILAVFFVNYLLFSGLGSLAVAIVQTLVGVVLTPFAGIFLTVLYVNSRIKQEECNAAVLARDMKLEGSESYNAVDLEPEMQLDSPLYKDETDEPAKANEMV